MRKGGESSPAKPSELNAKQLAAVERRMLESIDALRQVSMILGLIAPCKALTPTEDEIRSRLERYGIDMLVGAVDVILSSEASPVNRAAAGMLLECFVPNWRAKASPELVGRIVHRDDQEVASWRAAVFERDGHRCQECGSNEQLHAHHIVRWADEPSLRVVVNNGLTLCRKCHEAVHAKS